MLTKHGPDPSSWVGEKYVQRCSRQSEKELHVQWSKYARGTSEIPCSLGGLEDAQKANGWAACWRIYEIFLDEEGEQGLPFYGEGSTSAKPQTLRIVH